MSHRISLGFSSCPNDTFMFHGLMSGAVDVPGVSFEPVIEDIESLNRRVLDGDESRQLAVTKLSVSAFGCALTRYGALRSGAALGRGCGPLVVGSTDHGIIGKLADLRGKKVAVPGLGTTAHLLFRFFGPDTELVPMRFDTIMPAVADGKVDAGVIIHESRFTFSSYGLVQIADLGACWEESTGLPLPLGVIAARRDLPRDLTAAIEGGLQRSIEYARRNPEASRGYIREHAAELDDKVCQQHIDLYVNDFSVDLGDEGHMALTTLMTWGVQRALLPPFDGALLLKDE